MNKATLDEAEREARRFLERVKALHKRMEPIYTPARPWDTTLSYHRPHEAAAVKRSSLDLSRALSNLRRVQ